MKPLIYFFNFTIKNKFHLFFFEIYFWGAHFIRWIPGNVGCKIRSFFYRRYFSSCGKKVSFDEGCYIRGFKNISLGTGVIFGVNCQLYSEGSIQAHIQMGNHVVMNSNVMINANQGGPIVIGNNVLIGPNVIFRSANHHYLDKNVLIKNQGHEGGSITVKDDVWIGANANVIFNSN